MGTSPPDDGYFVSSAPPSEGRPAVLPTDEVARARQRRADRRRESLTLGVVIALALVAFQLRPDPVTHLATPDAVAVRTGDGAGSYRFLAAHPDGAPVRWDPCSPIRYVVNLDRAPYDTSLEDVAVAFERVTEVSGLRFAFAGETDEVATIERPLTRPDRYGPGWAPVLVAWTDPGRSPSLEGDVVASAMPVATGGDRPVYVSGSIHLDATQDLRAGFGRGRAWGTVLLHEAGHLVGLEHVSHEGEVMHPGGERSRASATVRWGIGDRRGLRLVGLEAGCQEVPVPPVAAVAD